MSWWKQRWHHFWRWLFFSWTPTQPNRNGFICWPVGFLGPPFHRDIHRRLTVSNESCRPPPRRGQTVGKNITMNSKTWPDRRERERERERNPTRVAVEIPSERKKNQHPIPSLNYPWYFIVINVEWYVNWMAVMCASSATEVIISGQSFKQFVTDFLSFFLSFYLCVSLLKINHSVWVDLLARSSRCGLNSGRHSHAGRRHCRATPRHGRPVN